MEDFLLALLEFFAEVVLELAGEAIFDLALRAITRLLESTESENPVAAASGYFVLGAMAGGFSLLIFPHHLFRPSRIRGGSLLISPIATGAIMSVVGSVLRGRGKRSIQIETFWYGFAFALGMALIRFLFAA